ncbi:MAG: rRNA maturation RNase YbeY, partial [Anaerolineae bacterium]
SEPAEERISIQIDEPFVGEVDADDLAATVAAALEHEGRADAEVTLVIADDETVAALNRQYRGIDGPTDVLSFPAQEPTPGFVSAPEAEAYLGDIIIALPFTRRQAAGLGRPLSAELRLLAVHGVLHLLGYDHAEPDEEAVMWARQDAILSRLAP